MTGNDNRGDDKAAVSASNEFIRMFVVSALALALFSGGVYWIRQLPTDSGSHDQGSVVEVKLLQPDTATPVNIPAQDRQQDATRGTEGKSHEPEPVWDANEEQPSPSPVAIEPAATTSLDVSPTASSQVPSDEALAKFREELMRHIAHFEQYPREARARGEQGTVKVLFKLRRDGRIASAWVATSSGETALDEEAVATLYRAEPLPPIPGEMPNELRILLPINFSLR